jgi:Zn-dependent peptidase ImmA (M78 family)
MATQTIQLPSEWIRLYQSSPPVNVKKMADDLGLRVLEFSEMPTEASGKLYPDSLSRAGWSIGVNAKESYTRKRFTIAHEIAHFLLHRNSIRGTIFDDTLYRSSLMSGAQETEANKFAADILMPYHLLEQMAQRGVVSVDELASKFGVSTQAMSIRLGIPLP